MDLAVDGRPALEAKVVLVTGASKGIGRAIAAACAASGASVMLSSRKPEALEAAVDGIAGAGIERDRLAWFAANAGDPEAASRCVEATMDRFGRVDVLVNNAATNPYMGRMIDIDLPRLDKTAEVNLRGPFVWTQLVWRTWMEAHGGSVLNIASVGGMTVETSIGHYNVTKAGLIHLTRSLAKELAPAVRVNAIAPGLVKTDMARALWEADEAGLSRMIPAGRLGEPDDIAAAAVFLSSEAASWITGTTMVVDGGMIL
jgi:NAD(P)-dependent dehydrogenase (short-subunit alcohol dehydrogenase family)